MIDYISTRGGGEPQTFEQVLLSGLAPDGGLYIPNSFPQLDLNVLKGKPYIGVAEAVMFPFVEGCIPRDDFCTILESAYSQDIFHHPRTVPLKKLSENLSVLELFYGPTIAFKDVALQLLGRLFAYVLDKRDEQVTIIGATSGDTGSAAIEGCKSSARAQIFILHPHERVSDVQRKQMTTVDAPNVHNIALEGTFDDCQALVKAMFNDAFFRKDMNLCAVNSINWARIMAQIVYYVTSAIEAGAPEEDVSFVVPTGNFGNVFAAWCAKQMGLPIKTLAIATNKNDILTRFFETNEMKKTTVEPTISPSMDIQVSSNFERYLFFKLDKNTQRLRNMMDDFQKTGAFSLPDLQTSDLKSFRANDTQTKDTIRNIFENYAYTLDPHTAVGMHGALELAKSNEHGHVISLACAHPAKFPDAVESAINQHPTLPKHLEGLMDKKESMTVLKNDLDIVQNFIKKQS